MSYIKYEVGECDCEELRTMVQALRNCTKSISEKLDEIDPLLADNGVCALCGADAYLEKMEQVYDEVDALMKTTRKAVSMVPITDSITPLMVDRKELALFSRDVKFGFRDGVYRIVLPSLLGHKTYGRKLICYKSAYINSLIWFALEYYFDDHPVERIDDAAILFVHTYSRKTRKKDHDNIEAKACIDRIANYLIRSDGGVDCELHNISKNGETDSTTIYVMSQEMAREHLYDVIEWDFPDLPQ